MCSLMCIYYPHLVIMPVDNNEHQRIDDVSTDRISYGIQSLETMGFTLLCMNCLIVYSRYLAQNAAI